MSLITVKLAHETCFITAIKLPREISGHPESSDYSVLCIIYLMMNMLRAHQKSPKTEGTSEEMTATHDIHAEALMAV